MRLEVRVSVTQGVLQTPGSTIERAALRTGHTQDWPTQPDGLYRSGFVHHSETRIVQFCIMNVFLVLYTYKFVLYRGVLFRVVLLTSVGRHCLLQSVCEKMLSPLF